MEHAGFTNEIDEALLVARAQPRTEDHRGYYFRDITAIIHSYPFRRLKHKTQVFFAPKNDHICTRIEHVLHVATISATICRALDLDVNLAWAISLGHDFGHTPFGHVGERILSEILADSGGFNHEIYSLYVVDKLIAYGKGLNLTHAVRDGIITHCGEVFEQRIKPQFEIRDLSSIETLEYYPCTWEGVVMRMSDKVAYLGRDLEDAVSLKLVKIDDVPPVVRRTLGKTNSEIIDTLVNDLIETADPANGIGFSDDVFEATLALRDFNYSHIYENPSLSVYHEYFRRILMTLYDYLTDLYERYGFTVDGYAGEQNTLSARFGDYVRKMRTFYEDRGETSERIVTDYLAGMTDDYAIECIQEIMIPKRFEIHFDEHLYRSR